MVHPNTLLQVDKVEAQVKETLGKKPWKPKVDNLNVQIIHNKKFVQLNKFYHLYSNMDRMQLENVVVRYMVYENMKFEDIEKNILQDLYNRLINRKRRVVNEDIGIREN